jgi:hypothetical protein
MAPIVIPSISQICIHSFCSGFMLAMTHVDHSTNVQNKVQMSLSVIAVLSKYVSNVLCDQGDSLPA